MNHQNRLYHRLSSFVPHNMPFLPAQTYFSRMVANSLPGSHRHGKPYSSSMRRSMHRGCHHLIFYWTRAVSLWHKKINDHPCVGSLYCVLRSCMFIIKFSSSAAEATTLQASWFGMKVPCRLGTSKDRLNTEGPSGRGESTEDFHAPQPGSVTFSILSTA